MGRTRRGLIVAAAVGLLFLTPTRHLPAADSAPAESPAGGQSPAMAVIDAAIKSLETKPAQGFFEVKCIGFDNKGGDTTVNQALHGGAGNTHVENMVGIEASGCGKIEVIQNVASQTMIDRSAKAVQILKEIRAAAEENNRKVIPALLEKLGTVASDVLTQILTALLLKKVP